MQFNSFGFAVFLTVVVLLYYQAAGQRFRLAVLLAASVFFYGALEQPHLLAILTFVVLVSYGVGLAIEQTSSAAGRRALLTAAIVLDLLPLLFLRYFPLVTSLLTLPRDSLWTAFLGKGASLGVSIGVSFYSFQAIAYLVDVSWKVIPAERSFGPFALSLLLFPKMLQGPIERSGELVPQLKELRPLTYENLRYGLVLFTLGAFKKLVIADRLAPLVNLAYGDVHAQPPGVLALATLGYAIQLYTDFSGYTDMALGIGRLFGLRLTENFRYPYFATSIADFWRRWHISLSQWLLHYLFMPLQKAAFSWGRYAAPAALLVTFAVCGLWHGASLGFLLWGLLNGFYMAFSLLTRKPRRRLAAIAGLDRVPRIYRSFQVLTTFTLVCVGWVFFRAGSVQDAFYVLSTVGQGLLHPASLLPTLDGPFVKTLMSSRPFFIAAGLAAWLTFDFAGFRGRTLEELFARPWHVRWTVYYALLLAVIVLGVWGSSSFLYFQF